ncbi:hypothetical protein PIB30_059566 [Stylosanthes scabra]|uniref:Uncharacterized protein n=1 Tax=Stylosanthes scabra TaxID=79078 RepID=A0ABU6YHQ9_9FABA|nr:hypothetical protein [Stylosanthes scabra]
MWGLLEHCKTPQLGKKIASTIGAVKECEVFENQRDHTRFIKATVSVNIQQPQLAGASIGSHEDSNCERRMNDENRGSSKSKNLGPWLKAEIIGVRINATEKGNSKVKPHNEEAVVEQKGSTIEKTQDQASVLEQHGTSFKKDHEESNKMRDCNTQNSDRSALTTQDTLAQNLEIEISAPPNLKKDK